MAENTKDSANTVQWGGIVAGAAVAAGAVLVFPTVLPDVAAGLTDVGAAITEAVTSFITPAAEAAAPSAPLITGEVAKTIAGATLVGGGLAYMGMSGGNKSSADAMFDEATAAQEQDGFAAREDVKRMQALMMARMQAANPQHMAAFAGAQQVR